MVVVTIQSVNGRDGKNRKLVFIDIYRVSG